MEQKHPEFGSRGCPKIQGIPEKEPLYLVSRGEGEISFPPIVHRDLTYISPAGEKGEGAAPGKNWG